MPGELGDYKIAILYMAVRKSECYRFGPFQLDAIERELRRGDTVVTLPGKAFDLLLVLVRGAGQTVTKSQLMSALWPDAKPRSAIFHTFRIGAVAASASS